MPASAFSRLLCFWRSGRVCRRRGFLPGCFGRLPSRGRRELHTFSPRLGKANSNRLLCRAHAVLAATNVLNLFPDELPCLGGRSLAFALGFTRSSESLLLGRHALRIWPSIKLSFFAFAVRETGTNKGTSRKMQPASIWLIPLSSRLAFDLVKRSR